MLKLYPCARVKGMNYPIARSLPEDAEVPRNTSYLNELLILLQKNRIPRVPKQLPSHSLKYSQKRKPTERKYDANV